MSNFKNVDAFSVTIKGENQNFDEYLNSDFVKDKVLYSQEKDVEIQFVTQKNSITVGVMITTKKTGIPPKHKANTTEYSAIDLVKDEGLAYANVFLYDSKKNILLYEFNRNGAYINKFISFFQTFLYNQDGFGKYELSVEPITTSENYAKMMKLNYYKSIEFRIAQPTSLIKKFKAESEPLTKLTEVSDEIGSEYISIKMGVSSTRSESLITNGVQRIANCLFSESHVEKLIVVGYEIDEEDEHSNKNELDLISERVRKSFFLEESEIQTNLQEVVRIEKILEIYDVIKEELKEVSFK